MKNVFVRFTHAVLLILLLSALIVGCADPDPDSDSGSELAITTFSFEAAKNSALNADVTGTIDATNYTIALSVPYGTTVTALVATFTTTGSSVVIGSTTQVSGSTANDFTSSVTYTVMAADGTTRDYTVTVTISNASSAEITAFSFEAAKNSALNADVTGTIDATNYTIALSVPYGTTVTALVATFTTTGSSVVIGSTTQVSRYTANDFTSAVTYTATAADATTREYIVTVTISSATWVQDAYLKASNTGADDNFGYSVAVSGELIVVGAYQEANNSTAIDNTDNGSITEVSTAYTGAAYVFKKDGENWVQDAYLKASNTGVNDNFGYSVAISGELIVVGTYLEDNSSTAIDNSDNGSITDAGTASNSGA
ncbi:FG-GAP repeat protein, partial [bacterium]|nr:FG-GAP repeat protein [bacterium]